MIHYLGLFLIGFALGMWLKSWKMLAIFIVLVPLIVLLEPFLSSIVDLNMPKALLDSIVVNGVEASGYFSGFVFRKVLDKRLEKKDMIKKGDIK